MIKKREYFNGNLKLMSSRLGIYEDGPLYMQPKEYKKSVPKAKNDFLLDGLNDQSLRLGINGGYRQQERMIFDKRRSLDRALLFSYQGANIKKVSDVNEEIRQNEEMVPIDQEESPICRALINPNKNKPDYERCECEGPGGISYVTGLPDLTGKKLCSPGNCCDDGCCADGSCKEDGCCPDDQDCCPESCECGCD